MHICLTNTTTLSNTWLHGWMHLTDQVEVQGNSAHSYISMDCYIFCVSIAIAKNMIEKKTILTIIIHSFIHLNVVCVTFC